jgi:hypothetical protein
MRNCDIPATGAGARPRRVSDEEAATRTAANLNKRGKPRRPGVAHFVVHDGRRLDAFTPRPAVSIRANVSARHPDSAVSLAEHIKNRAVRNEKHRFGRPGPASFARHGLSKRGAY